ncbi:MAG: MgtC/SapB family protein [Pirellulaceae bacterium]
MDVPWEFLEMVARLALAAVAGSALGWEREWHEKPAGLRTHMLVSLGAAAFMVAALEYTHADAGNDGALRLDPLRVVSGIVGGVGFLGAGSIIRSRGSVEGITTAASIWLAAAIGTISGLGFYALALTAGAMGFVILFFLGVGERKVLKRFGRTDHEKLDGERREPPSD